MQCAGFFFTPSFPVFCFLYFSFFAVINLSLLRGNSFPTIMPGGGCDDGRVMYGDARSPPPIRFVAWCKALPNSTAERRVLFVVFICYFLTNQIQARDYMLCWYVSTFSTRAQRCWQTRRQPYCSKNASQNAFKPAQNALGTEQGKETKSSSSCGARMPRKQLRHTQTHTDLHIPTTRRKHTQRALQGLR